MSQLTIVEHIRNRINILRSEQVGLKLFIQSDQCRHDALERAITELNWVLELLEKEQKDSQLQ
ncbi:MAG: hypothetical protein ACOX4Y_10385 [Limnochordia bacterium]|jgi:hypothetical protein